MVRVWLGLGALGGLLSVGLGAFGAHALRSRVPEGLIATWETATTYLGMHALALLLCALLSLQRPGLRLVAAAAWAFVIGTLLFSGSLIVLVLSGVPAWGAVTPFGGVTLMLAWALLAVGAWRGLR